MMSRMYEKIKKYYIDGYWPASWVKAVEGKYLTHEEVEEILSLKGDDN